jgi:hypothetical protein
VSDFHSQAAGRIASFVLLGLAVLVLTATGRLFYEGGYHLKEAMRLQRSNDRKAAIVELEDAAKAYVPGSPYPKIALRELEVLAKSAEMRGDMLQATVTWEVARRAVLATRHFFQPHEEQLESSEREIARLRKKKDAQNKSASEPGLRPKDPNPFASLLLFLGLIGWLGGAIALCLIPLRADSAGSGIRHYAWIACFGGLALWVAMAWIAG